LQISPNPSHIFFAWLSQNLGESPLNHLVTLWIVFFQTVFKTTWLFTILKKNCSGTVFSNPNAFLRPVMLFLVKTRNHDNHAISDLEKSFCFT